LAILSSLPTTARNESFKPNVITSSKLRARNLKQTALQTDSGVNMPNNVTGIITYSTQIFYSLSRAIALIF
jgi:hypothetical protein